ncbi:hypothetical protein CJ739_2277 [Mariniflexile rhizosphaerae]|nr:hypothetical protein CJ739_2277 [Mariniflexile sp. TRM1-10]
MTKIQIYSDVSLSAVEDIENIGFNHISTLLYLEYSRKVQCDTLQFLSGTKINLNKISLLQ